MKKLVLWLLLLSAFGLVMPASAQVQLGLIGGLNLANISVDPDSDPKPSSLAAFGVGGIVHIRLGENLALQLEPMYLQKGAKQEGSFTDPDLGITVNTDIKVKGNYLEVPAMLKLAFGTSTTKPYLMAGPMVGFLLSAKVKGSISAPGFTNLEIDDDIKDQTKSIDFGVGFGGGVSFPAGTNSIFVEGRYALGLTNINDDPEDPDTDVKTKGIQVMAGITFPIGQ